MYKLQYNCEVCHGHWWLMSSWTVSSMLLNTQWGNRSPIPRTWNIINTATQKLSLLHFKVAGFKQITREYKTVLYEWTQKKPLTNRMKYYLTSKNRFWLNCLSQLKDFPRPKSWDLLFKKCQSRQTSPHWGEMWQM